MTCIFHTWLEGRDEYAEARVCRRCRKLEYKWGTYKGRVWWGA